MLHPGQVSICRVPYRQHRELRPTSAFHEQRASGGLNGIHPTVVVLLLTDCGTGAWHPCPGDGRRAVESRARESSPGISSGCHWLPFQSPLRIPCPLT